MHAAPPDERRRRVLISAYACGPGQGSEPGAGWAFARAAATHSDVWVVTRQRFEPSIHDALAAEPDLAANLHVIYLDLSRRVLAVKRRPRDVYWYYFLWQRRVREVAQQLHTRIGFDVAHHVTFASDWQPCGLRVLTDVPLVWGPVGGSTHQPWRLARWLGWRGLVGEVMRSAVTSAARRVWGDPAAAQAALVVAYNADVAARFRGAARMVVEPNIALYDISPPARRPKAAGAAKDAIFVGRLVPWKGARLAVCALARHEASGWTLRIFGEGPDKAYLERLAHRRGVSERVSFMGQASRAEVLLAMQQADAMLFPSMHDSGPWAVGEASAAGCPVICLDRGGPPLVADINAHVVPVGGDVIGGLAQALRDSTNARAQPTTRWKAERLPALTASWYAMVIADGVPTN